MRKLFICFSVVTACMQAQTLTQSNHAPVAGDSYQTYQCDSLNVVPGPSGAGQSWNYVIATHSSMQSSYVFTTNSNPAYAAASVSLSAPAGNTAFYDSDVNSFRYYGGHMIIPQQADAHFFYTAPAVYAAYPMSLNTTSTTAVAGSVNILIPVPANGTFTGTCIVTADATGTLTLPGVVYNNIIRVMTTQTLDCTTNFGNGTYFQELYDYYQVGIKPPVFTISNATLSTPLGDEFQTIVTRLVMPTNTVGVAEHAWVQQGFYPNPASDKIHFVNTGKTVSAVYFISVDGRFNAAIQAGPDGAFDISALPAGVYSFRASDASGSLLGTGRQVIIR